MLLKAIPFFPPRAAGFAWPNAGKGHDTDRGTATGLPFNAFRVDCTSSRVAATVGFGFVADSGRITLSVGFLPGNGANPGTNPSHETILNNSNDNKFDQHNTSTNTTFDEHNTLNLAASVPGNRICVMWPNPLCGVRN
jgi:hypothetical protein